LGHAVLCTSLRNEYLHEIDVDELRQFTGAIVAACVADIAFVIDNSGSIRDNNVPGSDNWQIMIDFVKSIIELYTISPDVTRIAVVDFGQYQ